MRILFLGNNWVAWKVSDWLREQGEEIVGVVIHPPEKRKYGEKIISSCGVGSASVFNATRLNEAETVERIRNLRPEIGISAYFGYILRTELIRLMPRGCLNIHPAFLPYNRGVYPNVWSIIDGTPAGVTIHYIDEGVDTGDIVAQKRVVIEPIDTGESLYRKLELAALYLFKATWPAIGSGQANRIPQEKEAGTFHRLGDIEQIDEIALSRSYDAGDIIDIIRARTFPPYPGAYFLYNGRKIYLRLQLLTEEQLQEEKRDRTDHND